MNLRVLLYRAASTRFGIVVRTSDPLILRQRLYAERKKAKDPRLDKLVLSPDRDFPDSKLWIINPDAQEERDTSGAGDAPPL